MPAAGLSPFRVRPPVFRFSDPSVEAALSVASVRSGKTTDR
jgi:hypothetical protein